MTDSASSYFSGNQGPMHSGSGDINQTLLLGATVRKPRQDFIEELDWLWRRFVYPPGYGRASEILEARRTLLLDGVPGSGRIATAKVLLRAQSSGSERFHVLTWEERDGSYRLQPDSIGDDDRVWLDLSQTGERGWRAFQEELSSLRKAISAHAALLVVVLPAAASEGLWPEFLHYRSRIHRPSSDEVLRRYLRLEGVPDAVTCPPPEFLRDERPLMEIAKFAGLVAMAHGTAPDAGYRAWYEAAEAAYTGHGAAVGAAVEELRLGPQRALLLATAMLHHAHVDHIYSAAAALLDVLGYDDPDHVLERSDLRQSLKEIGAHRDPEGHVRLTHVGYDAAVRTHFWHYMPTLRDGIQQWISKMIDNPDLDQDRDWIVTRFADLCLHPRYRQSLVEAVAKWTRGQPPYRRQAAAFHALRHALSAEEHGAYFRRQVLTWACEMRLPEALAQVIIRVCVEVIALTHPDQAIVRLHHLARREGRATSARTVLQEMVADDPWLRRLLLARLTRSPAEGKEWERDVDLFLDIADPAAFTDPGNRNSPLIAEPEVSTMLCAGWRRVFHERGETAWKATVRKWLQAAFDNERHCDALLDALVNGGGQHGETLGHLYREARFVSDSRDSGAAFVNRVLRKICTVQGIQIS